MIRWVEDRLFPDLTDHEMFLDDANTWVMSCALPRQWLPNNWEHAEGILPWLGQLSFTTDGERRKMVLTHYPCCTSSSKVRSDQSGLTLALHIMVYPWTMCYLPAPIWMTVCLASCCTFYFYYYFLWFKYNIPSMEMLSMWLKSMSLAKKVFTGCSHLWSLSCSATWS